MTRRQPYLDRRETWAKAEAFRSVGCRGSSARVSGYRPGRPTLSSYSNLDTMLNWAGIVRTPMVENLNNEEGPEASNSSKECSEEKEA